MKIFLDTSSLLNLQEKAFESNFYISYVTLLELESIKTSQNKSDEIKFKARKCVRLLNENLDKFTALSTDISKLEDFNLQTTNDNIIVYTAWEINQVENDVVFYTDDICLKLIAKNIFKLEVKSVNTSFQDNIYTGYKEVIVGADDLAFFYNNLNINHFNCLTNEYLIIKDTDEKIIDKRKWNGESYVSLKFNKTKDFRPLNIYQDLAFDCKSCRTLVTLVVS